MHECCVTSIVWPFAQRLKTVPRHTLDSSTVLPGSYIHIYFTHSKHVHAIIVCVKQIAVFSRELMTSYKYNYDNYIYMENSWLKANHISISTVTDHFQDTSVSYV